MDVACGYVILTLVDNEGNTSRTIRANYDDEYGIGSDEELHAAETLTDGVLTCQGPEGRIPGFKKCGALAKFMITI
jgi:hypothetical protein